MKTELIRRKIQQGKSVEQARAAIKDPETELRESHAELIVALENLMMNGGNETVFIAARKALFRAKGWGK